MNCHHRVGSQLLRPVTVALVLLGLLGLLTACGTPPPAAREAATVSPGPTAPTTANPASPVRLVDPVRFADVVDRDDVVVINVHTPDEGSIAGTDVSIPFDRIRDREAELPADRDTPLAVYCRTGTMSAAAVTTLAQMGFRDITELAGGMQAWQASGRPLVVSGP